MTELTVEIPANIFEKNPSPENKISDSTSPARAAQVSHHSKASPGTESTPAPPVINSTTEKYAKEIFNVNSRPHALLNCFSMDQDGPQGAEGGVNGAVNPKIGSNGVASAFDDGRKRKERSPNSATSADEPRRKKNSESSNSDRKYCIEVSNAKLSATPNSSSQHYGKRIT